MSIIVRRAEPKDGPAIAGLQQSTWRETYPGLLPASILENLDISRLSRTWQQELTRQDDDLDHASLLPKPMTVRLWDTPHAAPRGAVLWRHLGMEKSTKFM